MSAPSATTTKAWQPLDPGSLSPVSVRYSPALVEARITLAARLRAGMTPHSAGQKPPASVILAATSGGIPFKS
jgi:hypothetical protein